MSGKGKAAAGGKTKKGGKGAGKGDAAGGGPEAAAREEAERVKAAYELQRQRDRLTELEEENKKLREGHQGFEERLEEHSKKQRDIIWYLHREIKSRDEELAALKAKHLELLRAADTARSGAEKSLHERTTAWATEKSDMETRYRDLKERFDDLDSFMRQREEMERTLAGLRAELEAEKRRHAVDVQELERRNVAEKAHLKKEMLRKVKETKISLLALTQDQLSTTTRRTIEENEQATTELHYQSRLAEQLVAQNNELTENCRALRRQLDLRADSERMLSERTVFLQKVIRKLNEKVRSLEGAATRDRSRAGAKERDDEEELARRESKVTDLRGQLRELERALQVRQSENQELASRLEQSVRGHQRLLQMQDEGVTFVLACLEDVKRARRAPPIALSYAARQAGADGEGADGTDAEGTTARRQSSRRSAVVDALSASEREEILASLLVRLRAQPESAN